jgi:hypothetical protein
MHSNYCARKTWAALAAMLIPLIAVCGGPDRNTISPGSAREWHAPPTNRLDSVNGMTSGLVPFATVKPGWLGLVISASPEGAAVEKVVIGGLAWQAGVRSGDVIVAVNNKLVLGLGLPRIAQLLREPAGSEIELTLRRPGKSELLKVKPNRVVPSPEATGLTVNGVPNGAMHTDSATMLSILLVGSKG